MLEPWGARMATENLTEGLNTIDFGPLGGGDKLGGYRQVGQDLWREDGVVSGGDIFEFRETARDANSVHLHDTRRNVHVRLDLVRKVASCTEPGAAPRDLYAILGHFAAPTGWLTNHDAVDIQLDLWRRKVRDAETGKPMADLYDIVDDSAAVSGWTVNRVDAGASESQTLTTYRQVGATSWEEAAPGQAGGFSLHETGRDDGSVHLHDPSRNVDLQLDLRLGGFG